MRSRLDPRCAAAALGLTLVVGACAPDVDPLDYGCTELWVREASCVDAEAVAHVVRERLWAPGEEVMGFAFALGDAGGTLVKGACGLARTAKDGGVRVFEPDMGIESGSTSKMLTAVAALRVLELGGSGQDLQASMNDFLPTGWAPHADLAAADLRLADLMQHRSGIVNTGGIGLQPVLQDPQWFNPAWVGEFHYANHNIDAVGFMTAYLYDAARLRALELELASQDDYDVEINLAVRDLHYEILRDLTLEPLGIDADCIRFAAADQEVWLYADGKDQRGLRLPARTNCMTSGFLLSAPDWVDWAAGLHRGELLGPEMRDALNRWDASGEKLGWSGGSGDLRLHGGAYSPDGVGVRTGLVYRRDGFSAAVVTNSANAENMTSIAVDVIETATAGCD